MAKRMAKAKRNNMLKYELSIGEGYVESWGLPEAVRELLQNAIDQSVKSGSEYSIKYNKEKSTLELSNKKGKLEESTLLLGATDKSESEDMIGEHGEGYKLATLVATRLGKGVTIYNYAKKQVWTAKLEYSNRYRARVLTYYINKAYQWQEVPEYELRIVIDGISSEEMEEVQCVGLPILEAMGVEVDTKCEGHILCGDEYKGKVYVEGLYVMTDKELTYGYNLSSEQTHVELDRDRKSIATHRLQLAIGDILTKYAEVDFVVDMIMNSKYDTKFLSVELSRSDHADEVSNQVYEKLRKEETESEEVESEEVESEVSKAPVVYVGEYDTYDIHKIPAGYKPKVVSDTQLTCISNIKAKTGSEAIKIFGVDTLGERDMHKELMDWYEGVKAKLEVVERVKYEGLMRDLEKMI